MWHSWFAPSKATHKGTKGWWAKNTWKLWMLTSEASSLCSLPWQLLCNVNRWYNTPAQLVLIAHKEHLIGAASSDSSCSGPCSHCVTTASLKNYAASWKQSVPLENLRRRCCRLLACCGTASTCSCTHVQHYTSLLLLWASLQVSLCCRDRAVQCQANSHVPMPSEVSNRFGVQKYAVLQDCNTTSVIRPSHAL